MLRERRPDRARADAADRQERLEYSDSPAMRRACLQPPPGNRGRSVFLSELSAPEGLVREVFRERSLAYQPAPMAALSSSRRAWSVGSV